MKNHDKTLLQNAKEDAEGREGGKTKQTKEMTTKKAKKEEGEEEGRGGGRAGNDDDDDDNLLPLVHPFCPFFEVSRKAT